MKQLSAKEREDLLIELLKQVQRNEISEGDLLRTLRKDVLGMNQQEYAALVNVSRRTLSNIEKTIGNQTIDVLNKVFRPVGLKIGLQPRSNALLVR